MNSLFTGEPTTILIKGEKLPIEDKYEDNDIESNAEFKTKGDFTELHRLSYVIMSIDHDTSVVPRGAYKITPIHELRSDGLFHGLDIKESPILNMWNHFRLPESKEKRELIDRDEALFSSDFFDDLSQDVPRGQWSIQFDSSNRNVTVRSLLWFGYIAFHECNSKVFGGI